jgi:carbon storage regulator
MLVLSRKLGEQVKLGENILVTVVEIRGNNVRLGFAAPTDLAITRPDAAATVTADPASTRKAA